MNNRFIDNFSNGFITVTPPKKEETEMKPVVIKQLIKQTGDKQDVNTNRK